MKKLVTLICFVSFGAFANSNYDYSKNRVIVKIKSSPSQLQNQNITKLKNLFGRVYVAYTNDADTLYKELKSNQHVEYVEKDYIGSKNKLAQKDFEGFSPIKKATYFNDPHASRQWTLKDSKNNGISIESFFRRRRSPAENQVVVAVVDTGVDYNHEDLKMWQNPGEIPGNGIDDDDNGYVDDIYGINTLIRDSRGDATVDVKDAHGHGTHVSGSIGALQNNGIGIAGNASNVKIMAIRTVPNTGDEKDIDVIEAFIYAATNGAKIINCSFGKDHNEGGQAVAEAIDFIGKEYGVLVIAAAGNSSRNIDSRPTYPASFESKSLLVVASTTKRGSLSYFSNYGTKSVDVAAPGSGIYSTTPGNKYQSMSGTSMASPNTAGVAAEVLARYPHLSPTELKDVLMRSVTKVRGFERRVASGGRIDLEKAIELASFL